MAGKILIIEDEQKLAQLLADYLELAGFSTAHVADGLQAIPQIRQLDPALVILDLMLPGRDGLEICRELRTFSAVPVIMTTARVEEIDRLLGLELGADDYICKPYSPREVVARVKTVLRRCASPTDQRQQPGGLTLDPARYYAAVNSQPLDLTAIEFKLLQFLAAHPGQIFGRQQLMDKIYPDERIVADRTIDSHIKKLRKKIFQADSSVQLIHSIYGVGYKFERESL